MKILVSAYACEPNRGSEPGAGWNWVLAAARSYELTVLTAERHREAIERELEQRPLPGVRFEFPDFSWRWVRGERGLRVHALCWQVVAARRARRLARAESFDAVHHVTWANVWVPALAFLAGPPFVLGPVGGGARVPLRLYPALGIRGGAREALVALARWISRANPLVRLAWRRASVILVQNEETRAVLPRAHRTKALVRPNASVPQKLESGARARPVGPPRAVCAGRLLALKGISLAVRALTHLPEWELVVIGRGPEERRLQRLAERLGVRDRIRFLPWLPRADLFREIAAAHALVLPSLRDESPLVAAEAQALGVPVVALDQGGPAVFARRPHARITLVPRTSADECARGIADALRATTPWSGPRPDFGLDGIARDLDDVYRHAAAPSHAVGVVA